MMNDYNLDLHRLLRTFYEEAELCTDEEREQLIMKVVTKIQEKEQRLLYEVLEAAKNVQLDDDMESDRALIEAVAKAQNWGMNEGEYIPYGGVDQGES